MLNNNLKSILWIILWSIAFSLAMTFVKYIQDTPLITIIFLRFIFAGCISGADVLRPGECKKMFNKLKYINLQYGVKFFLYPVFACAAIWTNYYAYEQLPLGLATTIGFTGPMITIILAKILLHDHINVHKWIAIILGYIGVIIIIQPAWLSIFLNHLGIQIIGHSNLDIAFIAIIIAIASNVFAGLAQVVVKQLSLSLSTTQIMFIGNVANSLFTGIIMIFMWKTPPLSDVPYIILILAFGTLSQFSMLNAIKNGTLSLIMPFTYLKLIFSIPLGIILFKEVLTKFHIWGGLLIVFGSIYLTYIQISKNKISKL